MFENISKQLFANAFVGNHGIVNDLMQAVIAHFPIGNRPRLWDLQARIYNANCACEINEFLTGILESIHEENEKKINNVFGTESGFEL